MNDVFHGMMSIFRCMLSVVHSSIVIALNPDFEVHRFSNDFLHRIGPDILGT